MGKIQRPSGPLCICVHANDGQWAEASCRAQHPIYQGIDVCVIIPKEPRNCHTRGNLLSENPINCFGRLFSLAALIVVLIALTFRLHQLCVWLLLLLLLLLLLTLLRLTIVLF